MKYLEIRNIKSMSKLIALGLVAIAPMTSTVPALADDDDDDDDRRSYRVRSNSNRDVFRGNSELRTRLRGTVVEDRADYSFVLRTDDGRRVLVQTGNALANVSRGDVVVVRGFYNGGAGNSFTARRVRVTNDSNFDWNDNGDWNNNDWNNNYNRTTIRGTVTRDLWDNDEFEIRADNGRTYRVNLRNNEPRRLSQGDRVEVVGNVSGSNIRATSLRILSDNGGWNNGQSGAATLSGIVTRDVEGRRFNIRTNEGRNVQVIASSEPRQLSRGDRVYLRGRWNGSTFYATTLTLNNTNGGYNNTVGSRVNFPGVVTSIQSSTRFAVRADNGRNYSVQLNEQLPKKVDVGDRIRVQGTVIYGGIVRANDIDLLDNFNKRDDREDDERKNDRTVDMTGVVINTPVLGLFTVRNDNGREFRVRGALGQGVRRGDRVRIRGYRDSNNVITANNVTRY